MRKITAISLLIIFIFLFSILAFPSNGIHPWPMYRCNPQHTGRSMYSGPQNPTLKWKVKVEGGIRWIVVDKDENVYVDTIVEEKDWKVRTYETRIYKIRDGEIIWKQSFKGKKSKGGQKNTFLVLGSDELYTSINNTIYAIDMESGEKGLLLSLQGSEIIGLTPLDDGNLCFTTSDPYMIYIVDPKGKVKWKFRGQSSWGIRFPAIDEEGRIYTADRWEGYRKHKYKEYSGKVYVLTPEEGKSCTSKPFKFVRNEYVKEYDFDEVRKRESVTLPWSIIVYEDILYGNRTIYISAWGGITSTSDGKKVWRYQFDLRGANGWWEGWAPCLRRTVVGSDGTVYAIYGGYLIAINRKGEEKWIKSDAYGGLVMDKDDVMYIDRDDVLYFESSKFRSRTIIAVKSNGGVKWEYKVELEPTKVSIYTFGYPGPPYVDDMIGSASTLVLGNEMMYLANGDYLYAIGEKGE
ncbi:MAG: hypothetical protein DRP50_06945 [Thermotoga sp.]|nr:MAG: hypothetical protein DRP50_06945 [Thermotoga sp.]